MTSLRTGVAAMLAAFVAATAAVAQQAPQPIADYIQQRMPHEWYAQQRDLWKKEVDRNRNNADAWLNYYKATRYSGFGDTTLDQPTKYQQMQDLLDSMEKAIPDSYEYHYARWWAGGNNLELFPHLQKAYELKQDYADLSDDFICYYELTGDYQKKDFFNRQWYSTRAFAPGLMHYSYNVLMSLQPDAILVTFGDIDTYPLWMLQAVQGIRTDVTVLNASLINVPEYRVRLMKEEKIKGDASLLDYERMAETPYRTMKSEFLQSLAESNTERPVYFALTCEPEYLEPFREDLYTVGLAHRYSRERIDNIAILKRNWEKFHLDYLRLDIYSEDHPFTSSWLPQINMNYIAPALLLYEHHQLAGDEERARRFREFAMMVGRHGGEEKQVAEYIEGIGEVAVEDKGARMPARSEDLDSLLNVYPNPAYSSLTIELRQPMLAEFRLVRLDGSVVRSGASDNGVIRFDIGDVHPGMYVLNVITPRGGASRVVEVKR